MRESEGEMEIEEGPMIRGTNMGNKGIEEGKQRERGAVMEMEKQGKRPLIFGACSGEKHRG